MSEIVNVNGWEIIEEGEERLVSDLLLATKLGYEQPRDIRKLIKRMIADGRLIGTQSRDTVARQRTKNGGEREYADKEYLLSEVEAVLVSTQSKTSTAKATAREVAEVFVAYRKGLLSPAPPSSPLSEVQALTAMVGQLVGAVASLLAQQQRSTQREEQPLEFPIQPRAEYPAYHPQRPLALVTPRRAPQEDEPRFEWLAGVANQLGLSYPQASNIASIYGLFDTTHMRKAQTKSGRMGWMVDGFASAQIEDHARRMGLL